MIQLYGQLPIEFVLDTLGCTDVVEEDDEGRMDPDTDLVDDASMTMVEDVGIVVTTVV